MSRITLAVSRLNLKVGASLPLMMFVYSMQWSVWNSQSIEYRCFCRRRSRPCLL